MELSEAARTALINAQGRQGAPVVSGTVKVWEELFNGALISRRTTLTRKGTIERERLVNAALDAAFG